MVDYLIRRDKNLTDHIVLECEEPARPELDAAIAVMPEYFCRLAKMRPYSVIPSDTESSLMRSVKFLKASRVHGKNGMRYSLAVKVYNHLLGKYVTLSLTGIPEDALPSIEPFKVLFSEAELYASGHRGQESLFEEEEEATEPEILPLHQAS